LNNDIAVGKSREIAATARTYSRRDHGAIARGQFLPPGKTAPRNARVPPTMPPV